MMIIKQHQEKEIENQCMVDLPGCQVTMNKQFQHCGTNYTGFVQIKYSNEVFY